MSARPDRGTSAVVGFTLTAAVAGTLFAGFAAARALVLVLPFVALLVFALQPRAVQITRRLPVALVLFVAWCAVSYAWSADQATSQRLLLDLVAASVIAWCCGSLTSFDDLHRLMVRLFRVIVVVSFVALAVAPAWSTRPAVDGAPGWHALFSHKNGLGSFAVLALVTFWLHRGSRHRSLWVAACVVLVLGSQSSAALALVLLSGGVALWNNAFGTLRSPAGQAGYIGSSVLLVATGVTVFTAQVDLLTSLLGRSATLSGRTDIWASAWDAASTRPLHGYGFGGVWGSDVPPTDEIWRQLRFEAFHAHNGYLDLFLQVGLIGIALFLVAVGATLARTLQERTPGAGWAAAITFVLAVNAIGESGPFFGGGFLLLALFAVAAAQAPVREGTPAGTATPWDRRLSSSSR